MNKFLKKYFAVSLLLTLTVLLSSCTEEELGNDADKVVPKIFNFDGTTVAFIGDTHTFAVSPTRGGSEYIWTITGATSEATFAGRTDKMNITFNQSDELASISVVEKAANGKVSEAAAKEVKVFGTPCNWRIDMQDAYGDGWNDGFVSFTFDGYPADDYFIADGSNESADIAVPNGSEVVISFTSGAWDSEITYQVFDGSGALVYEDGPTPVVGDVYTGLNTCP